MESLARVIIVLALILLFIGLFMLLLAKIGFIPGNIVVRRGNFTFYLPLASMLLLSLILTFILNFFNRR